MQRVTLAFLERRRTHILIHPPWASVGDKVEIPVSRIPHDADPSDPGGRPVITSHQVEVWEIIEAVMIDGDVVIQERPGHA